MQPPLTQPGVYPGGGQAVLLRANQQQYLFQQQLVLAGQASIAVQLERIKSPHFYPFGLSFSVWFTDVNQAAATPGAFEVDFQTADLDIDSQYVTIQALVGTASLNASFVGRYEAALFWAKYARVLVKTLPNAVYTNVLVSR